VVEKMISWYKETKLTISSEKTYVLFKRNLNFNRGPIIKIHEKTIKREKDFKHLGLTMDEKLNVRNHTTLIK